MASVKPWTSSSGWTSKWRHARVQVEGTLVASWTHKGQHGLEGGGLLKFTIHILDAVLLLWFGLNASCMSSMGAAKLSAEI